MYEILENFETKKLCQKAAQYIDTRNMTLFLTNIMRAFIQNITQFHNN